MAFKRGMDFKLYRASSGAWGSEVWDEITIASNISLKIEFAQLDATIRGIGHKLSEPGLADMSIDFDLVFDHNHADFTALQTAALAGTALIIAMATGTIGTAGTVASGGTAGEFFYKMQAKLFGWPWDAPLDGEGKVSLTFRPCYGTNVPVMTTVA